MNTDKFDLIVTCNYGLESVLSTEIKFLGYKVSNTEDGRIFIDNVDALAIARLNINLRTAGKVLIKLSEINPCTDFEEIYQAVLKLNLQEIIPEDGEMYVTASSVKSKLSATPAIQSVTKRAIIDSMKIKYPNVEKFSETGPLFNIAVSIKKDKAYITLDTTGEGLFKRGYRKGSGEAPLKETLAAGLVLLSRWRSKSYLIDPFCGSGTILIEAAMIAKNIAPGINRQFTAMDWKFIDKTNWVKANFEAKEKVISDDDERLAELKIFGYDIDEKVLRIARRNAEIAGVDGVIDFHQRDIKDFKTKVINGFIITNPPYGERIGGSDDEVKTLYNKIGRVLLNLDGWKLNIYTGYDRIYTSFNNRKADKNRKLYNGKIKSYLYQFFLKRLN